MIYAVLNNQNNEAAYLFDRWSDYFTATFSPEIETICCIELSDLKGKSYRERKADIEGKAIELSNNRYPGLSIFEEANISAYFEKYGKRYGLLTEFRENAIC